MVIRLLNPPRRRTRWVRKFSLVALAVVFVLYPRPDRLVRNLQRWANLSALIEPDHPALEPLAVEGASLLAAMADSVQGPLSPRQELTAVQSLVYERIPYAWDWDTWSVADYIPTVAEAMAMGREDCDGRAVIAASLLARFGHRPRIVSDLSHMWVWTPQGQTMSPMETASGRTLVAHGEKGNRLDIAAITNIRALLIDWPTNFAYGIAVFPWWRTGLIALAVWAVLVSPLSGSARRTAGAAAFAGSLIFIGACSSDPWARRPWVAWGGFAGAGLGAWLAATPSQRSPTERTRTTNYRSM